MSKFDDQIQALIDNGNLSEADAAALRDASPLKAERDTARSEADAATARARALEAKVAADVFTKLNIPGAPGAYNLPADVDITDADQVTAWARANQLIPDAGPTAEEQAAHDRMNRAPAGTTPPVPLGAADKVTQLRKQVMTAGANQLGPGGELYQKTIDALTEAGLNFGDVDYDANFERIPEWGATK